MSRTDQPEARGDSLPAPAQPQNPERGSRPSGGLPPLQSRPAVTPTLRPTRVQSEYQRTQSIVSVESGTVCSVCLNHRDALDSVFWCYLNAAGRHPRSVSGATPNKDTCVYCQLKSDSEQRTQLLYVLWEDQKTSYRIPAASLL